MATLCGVIRAGGVGAVEGVIVAAIAIVGAIAGASTKVGSGGVVSIALKQMAGATASGTIGLIMVMNLKKKTGPAQSDGKALTPK